RWITYQLVRMSTQTQKSPLPETKRKLVDAGVSLMRHRGFNATTVDDICAAAGSPRARSFITLRARTIWPRQPLFVFTNGGQPNLRSGRSADWRPRWTAFSEGLIYRRKLRAVRGDGPQLH